MSVASATLSSRSRSDEGGRLCEAHDIHIFMMRVGDEWQLMVSQCHHVQLLRVSFTFISFFFISAFPVSILVFFPLFLCYILIRKDISSSPFPIMIPTKAPIPPNSPQYSFFPFFFSLQSPLPFIYLLYLLPPSPPFSLCFSAMEYSSFFATVSAYLLFFKSVAIVFFLSRV